MPGNVSLDSMLTEIRKLRAVRAVGLLGLERQRPVLRLGQNPGSVLP